MNTIHKRRSSSSENRERISCRTGIETDSVFGNTYNNELRNTIGNSCDTNFSNACDNNLHNACDNRFCDGHDQIELSNTCDSILGDNIANSNASETRQSSCENGHGNACNSKLSNSFQKRFGKACRGVLWKATKNDGLTKATHNKGLDKDTYNVKLKHLSESTQNDLKKLRETFEHKWGNVSDSLLDNAAHAFNQENLDSNKPSESCDNRHGNNCRNLNVAMHVGDPISSVGHNGFGNACHKLDSSRSNATHSGFDNACHGLNLNQHADNMVRNACQYGAAERERCDNIKPVKTINIDPGDILDVLQSDISDFNLDLLKDMSQFKSFHPMGGRNSYSSTGTVTSCRENVKFENDVLEAESIQKGAGFPLREYYTPADSYHTQPVFPGNMRIIDQTGTTFNDKTAGGGRIQDSAN